MADGANIRSDDVLGELQTAMLRFADDTRQTVRGLEQETQRTLDWLRERLNHWQRELEKREQALSAAKSALCHCEASGTYDKEGRYYLPNCSREQEMVLAARRAFGEAEAEQENVRGWAKLVQQAQADYIQQARRMSEVADSTIPKAAAQLNALRDRLLAYDSTASSSTIGAMESLGQLVAGLAEAPIIAASSGPTSSYRLGSGLCAVGTRSTTAPPVMASSYPAKSTAWPLIKCKHCSTAEVMP